MNHIEIKLNQTGVSSSEALIRSHKIVIDRPREKGGSDLGPMGGELLLAALGGCFNSNLLAAIAVRSAPISEIQLKIIGTLGGEPMVFQKIEVRVEAECQDRELLRKLVTIADRSCISSNTLKSAGVDVSFLTD